MKNVKYIFSVLFFFLIFMMSSCSDPCKDVQCVNGECIDGVCDCLVGFEGDDCNTLFKTKFFGDYTMLMETCTGPGSGMVPYSISITDSQIGSSGPLTFFIEGLYGNSDGAIGFIDSNGLDFTFSRTVFGFFGIEMDGSGTFNPADNSIQVTYSRYDPDSGSVLDGCTGTIVKI